MDDHGLRLENMAVACRYLTAINDYDFDAFREILADSIVLEWPYAQPGVPGRVEGKVAAMSFLMDVPLTIECENLHGIRIDTRHSDPAEVITEFNSDMKMVAPVSYKNHYIGLFTVRDGKVQRFAQYYDPLRYIFAFGGRIEAGPVPDR